MKPTPFLLLQLCALSASAQGVFQDLNFESANVVLDSSSPYYPNAVAAANAFPGWTVSGSVTAPDVFYNDVSLGSPAVSLQGPGSFEPVLQGSYSAFLQGNVSISQTGQIPGNAQSLLFYASQLSSVEVTFNGQELPYFAIGSGSSYTIYGANISAYAGSTGPLAFMALPDGQGLLDNISFSNQPIPEPATWTLLVGGAGLVGVAKVVGSRSRI